MPFPGVLEPGTLNIVLRRGSDFRHDFAVTATAGGAAVDLTGCTIAAKTKADFAAAPLLTFTFTAISLAGGTFRITATPAQIATAYPRPGGLPATQRTWDGGVWDLEITDGTSTTRAIEGTVTISDEATV